jgi:hypothetical protein
MSAGGIWWETSPHPTRGGFVAFWDSLSTSAVCWAQVDMCCAQDSQCRMVVWVGLLKENLASKTVGCLSGTGFLQPHDVPHQGGGDGAFGQQSVVEGLERELIAIPFFGRLTQGHDLSFAH